MLKRYSEERSECLGTETVTSDVSERAACSLQRRHQQWLVWSLCLWVVSDCLSFSEQTASRGEHRGASGQGMRQGFPTGDRGPNANKRKPRRA